MYAHEMIYDTFRIQQLAAHIYVTCLHCGYQYKKKKKSFEAEQ